MKTNKEDIINYFIYVLLNRYKKENSTIILNRYNIQIMLILASIKNNNIINNLGEGLNFNNFFVFFPYGIIELSLFNHINKYEIYFENKIQDINLLTSNIKNNIDIEIKKEIIKGIYLIEGFLFQKDHNYLIKYIETFDFYKIPKKKMIIYNKRGYKIENKELYKENNFLSMTKLSKKIEDMLNKNKNIYLESIYKKLL